MILAGQVRQQPANCLIQSEELQVLHHGVAVRKVSSVRQIPSPADNGTAVEKIHDFWGAFVESVTVDDHDALDAALLDAADDFRGAMFNVLSALHPEK